MAVRQPGIDVDFTGHSASDPRLPGALQEGFQSIDQRLQEYGPLEPERFSLEEANRRLARREDLMSNRTRAARVGESQKLGLLSDEAS